MTVFVEPRRKAGGLLFEMALNKRPICEQSDNFPLYNTLPPPRFPA